LLGVLALLALLAWRLLLPQEVDVPARPADGTGTPRAPILQTPETGGAILPEARTGDARSRAPEPIRTETVAVEEHASATARVIDRAGQPIVGAVLRVHRMQGQGLLRTRQALDLEFLSDDEGHVTLARLPVGLQLGVQADSPDFAPVERESFVVESGKTLDLGDIVMGPGFPLTGRVTDIAGLPIEAAQVEVAELGFLQGGDPDPVVVLTDADGNYRVEHIGPRQYTVEARADGYAADTTVLSLILGGASTGQRQDFQLLEAGSRLGGLVLGPDDGPVPACPLTLSRRDARRRTYSSVETVTDDDGRFLFESLAAGTYQLEMASDTHYLPAALRVDSGREDLVVRAQRGLKVYGILICDTDPPRRFDVRVLPDGTSGAGLLPGGDLVQHVIAADPPGQFVVDGLRPGSYRFAVTAEGWAVTTSADVIIGQDGGDAELQLRLLRGGTITGRVDPPVPDLTAELRGADYDPSLAIESIFPTQPLHALVAPTSADGRFLLKHVPPGDYTLSLRGADRPPVHQRGLQLEEGQTLDVGTLTLPLGGTLFGNVLGPDGRPRSGVRVTATSDGHHQEAVSDASGAFRMTSIPEGDYVVVAVPANLWEALRLEARVHVTVSAREEVPVLLPMAERATAPR
jgi:protocatechuate 3,4-dioxygenase beta subunit